MTTDRETGPPAPPEIRRWFEEFEACVRAVDFERGRSYFVEDAVAFGTRADVVSGLDNLVRHQWQGIWGNIRDFAFRLDQLHGGADGNLAWGVAPWTSTGFDRDGNPFPRPGRATVVFRRVGDRWLAQHTHFSLNPGTPPTTHGPRG